jgi:hypothetical protein
VAAHRQFTPPLTIKENIGDGFLLALNPVYRAVRKEFRRRGFRFSSAPHPEYYSFPLMSLDDAIARGAVPYRENFRWIEKLEKVRGFSLTELKRSELQFNYLFHESAHFIAHSVLFGKLKPAQMPKTAGSLLKVLMGEAFANTVECVAFLFAEGEVGGYLLDANCHFRTNEQEKSALLRVVRKTGLRKLTRAVFASFLYANYLYEGVGAKERRFISKLAGVDAKLLAPAIRVGFELSDIFRTDTTQLHLMKLGFPGDLRELMQGDPVGRLLANKKLLVQFHELIEIVVGEL